MAATRGGLAVVDRRLAARPLAPRGSAAPAALGGGERDLRAVQKCVDRRPRMRAGARRRDRDVQLAAGRAQRLTGHRRRDLVADAAQRLAVAQIGDEHGEATAADVRDRVVRAHAVREAAGELAQDGVADGVPAALVEVAQAVDVEQDERRACVCSRCERASSRRATSSR